VRVEPLGPANLVRSAQLLNKTNQLNLSTRRLSESELMEWTKGRGRKLWSFSVSDRFGDAGLTGLVSIEIDQGIGRIVDYVLSCRVMGRKVEESLMHLAIAEARKLGADAVEARYLKTAKNKPVLTFLEKSGLSTKDGELFKWEASNEYPLPEAVTLERVGW
jgi:FkbH-like protein